MTDFAKELCPYIKDARISRQAQFSITWLVVKEPDSAIQSILGWMGVLVQLLGLAMA